LNMSETRPDDPSTGGWISQDWSRFNGRDTNLGRYCGNSPTIGRDPSGMFTEYPGYSWILNDGDGGGWHPAPPPPAMPSQPVQPPKPPEIRAITPTEAIESKLLMAQAMYDRGEDPSEKFQEIESDLKELEERDREKAAEGLRSLNDLMGLQDTRRLEEELRYQEERNSLAPPGEDWNRPEEAPW
ncbi:MAG: hypothetical protein ABSG68_16975, partial [Thermoguttaceae bacterium]